MTLYTLLVTLHLLGFGLGVGGATASDITFVRSTKNGKVSKDEFRIIKALSVLVWSSVALIFISGTSLMLLEYSSLGEVPRLGWSFFQMKLVAFTILVANGVVFHKIVFPYLKSTIGKSFRSKQVKARYDLFALTGAISIVSWYSAFFLVAFSQALIDLPFMLLLSAYLMLICGGAFSAYYVLHLHANKSDLLGTLNKVLTHSFSQVALFGAVGFLALILMQLYFMNAVAGDTSLLTWLSNGGIS